MADAAVLKTVGDNPRAGSNPAFRTLRSYVGTTSRKADNHLFAGLARIDDLSSTSRPVAPQQAHSLRYPSLFDDRILSMMFQQTGRHR